MEELDIVAIGDEDYQTFKWVKVFVDVDEFLLMPDPTFRRHFRLTKPQFEILCEEVVEFLEDEEAIVRLGRDFRHKMMMVLWILATPDTYRSVALKFGVHPGEVHRYYKMIVEALCHLGERYITWPTPAERNHTKMVLEGISGFPNAVLMLDSKHITIIQPHDEPNAYINRHHVHSINMQALCDERLLIRDLYVGEAGSLHDARVLRRSPLYSNILFRPHEFFSEGEHIIGDSAYPLMDRLLTPFINNGHLNESQRNYNRALSRVRVKIEHTFGRYTTLWRRSKYLHVAKVEYAVDHVCACAVLHYFRILHGQEYPLVNVADNHPDFEPGPIMEDDYIGADEEELNPAAVIPDPFVPGENGWNLARQAQLRGDQKRWNITATF